MVPEINVSYTPKQRKTIFESLKIKKGLPFYVDIQGQEFTKKKLIGSVANNVLDTI